MRQESDLGALLPVRRKRQAGPDILLGQVGGVVDDLRPAHAGRHSPQHNAHRNPQSMDTGLLALLVGFDGVAAAAIDDRIGSGSARDIKQANAQ